MNLKHNIRKLIYNPIFFLHKKLFSYQFYNIAKLLVPSIFEKDKVALGKVGDGTYIIPETLVRSLENPLLLSFGVADDISFELDFLNKFPGTKAYCFDPSIEELPEKNENIYFESIGLAGKTNKKNKLYSIGDILLKLNIEKNEPMIVKMDIEGWEWGFIERNTIFNHNIPVITFELHFMEGMFFPKIFLLPYYFYKRYKALKYLLERYHIYHLHANNYKYLHFKKMVFPCLLEFTLVRKDLFTDEIIADVQKYNTPNCNSRTDYQYPFLKE